MSAVVLVIPCFNEEHRLDRDEVLRLAQHEGLSLLLVDDGSRDGTRAVLDELAARAPSSIGVLALAKNSGKSEAVRTGLRAAAATGAAWVGFADADLATPVEELVRLAAIAERGTADVVMGSRVAMAGTQIERKAVRHYLGRVFSTAAALTLQARFYDTQCGAKFFRNTDLLRGALEESFHSRWIFDVELLARLLGGVGAFAGLPVGAFMEVPLQRWTDVPGSRLRPKDLVKVGSELFVIWRGAQARRRRLGR
jgi:glycosyltransferase involved in cell wall biosynthesis